MARAGFAPSLVLCLSSVWLWTGAGCQSLLGIEDTRVEGEDPPDGSPGFTFSVLTTSVALPLDGAAVLDVEIKRTGGFDGAVEIEPTFVPSGLVVPPVTIPSGASTAELAVGAVAPFLLGDQVSFELRAVSGDLPVRTFAIDKALVTGKPASFDTAFGGGGTGQVRISFGADDGGAFQDIQLTADNSKLLVSGYGVGGLGSISQTVARLSFDGVLDAAFSSGGSPPGLLRISFAGTSGENARAAALGFQADGRMIAIGSHGNGSIPTDASLARISLTGAVGDNDFGNFANGKSRIDLGGDDDQVTDGVVLRSGATVAVGSARTGGGTTQLVVLQANLNGYPDGDFNGTGFFKAPDALQTRADAVAVDSRDRLVVVGAIGPDGQRDMLVLRLTATGALDDTFGTGGRVVLGAIAADERARAIAIRPDGRIVIAGTSNKNGNDDFELRQLLENGQPDPSFGEAGVSTPALTAAGEVATDMSLLPNGRIIVVGNNNKPIIARYTKSGALDPLFSADGIDTVPMGSSGTLRGVKAALDGRKIFLSGGDEGGSPGPGTFGVVVRMWM
jgi:uncharacterized delta-60 repeat protein